MVKNRLSLQAIVGLLIIGIAVTACGGRATPTPTPIAQAQEEQGPTVQIGSATLWPDKTMSVCFGQTVALITKATGRDLAYTWSLDGNGQLQRQEGKGDEGSGNRYTAPATSVEEVVKVTVTDDLNQSATDQVIIQVVECASPTPTELPVTDTPTPTEEPTAEPTEEPTAEPTEEPTAEPTEEPTAEPTEEPTVEPTEEPTAEPTEEPTVEPTEEEECDDDTSKYAFCSGPMGWQPQLNAPDTKAVTAVAQSSIQAKFGRASLELTVDLIGGNHQTNSKGEAFVDMRYNLPAVITTPAPYDLTGTTITCWVYAPPGSTGASNSPNGFQVFVKDENFYSEYGTWENITPEREGTWFPITLTPSTQTPQWGYKDLEFDPTHIILLGVKIGAGGQSTDQIRYAGPVYVDACDW